MSVTDRCNLRCSYCMPADGVPKLPHAEVLTLEEMARVARLAVGLGVDKIRLTGGEPLLRHDLGVLLGCLDALRPRPDLRLTTNGLLLSPNLAMLAERGVSTINVSLDTLRPERYGPITGLGPERGARAFRRVWSALEEALAAGGITVKLNVVLLAGLNDDELEDFAGLTRELPLAVRFIEYMPVGRHKEFIPERFLSGAEVMDALAGLGEPEHLPTRPGDGPARRFRLPGAAGELGIITAVSSHFCTTCNRLRLSAEGRLLPCLFSEAGVELKPLLRGGADDRELAAAILRAAREKPAGHGQQAGGLDARGCPMSRLGG
jgi:cyclic pyranopterin phosphate synthase